MEKDQEKTYDITDYFGSVGEKTEMFNKTKRQEEKMTVEIAADRYIEAILATEAYKEYALQRDKLLKQPELYEKVKEFRTKNYIIQIQKEGDDLLNAMDDLQREYESVREVPLVEDFLAAELAFCRMMQSLNHKVANALEFD